MHLSDGTLRRWIDEPFAVDAVRRRHLDACVRCRGRADVIRHDADSVRALMSATAPAPVSPAAALHRMRPRLREEIAARTARPAWLSDPGRRARITGRSVAGALAIGLGAAVVATGAAAGLFTIFQPRQFTPVTVTDSDVRSLMQLSEYGRISGAPQKLTLTAAPCDRAPALAGVRVTVPAAVTGVSAAPRCEVASGGTVSFMFDSARAAAAARRAGQTPVPMPAVIDHSVLQLTVPPVLIATYGIDLQTLLQGEGTLPAHAAAIVASRLPTVTSTGATAGQIEQYLLAQPGFPPTLAAEIRAISHPSTTLPVPIPLDVATAQHVSVNGTPGLLIGDNTGIGSVVLWQRSSTVYAVVGTLSGGAAVAVANTVR